MTDRRRINPPPGGTLPPIFLSSHSTSSQQNRSRTRDASTPRQIFLQTGLVPSASGSSYYEIQPSSPSTSTTLSSPTSAVKITCTVHGPRPLPRNTPYSANLLLSTHVKFAPFASRTRRGYVRDAAERDLGAHLETALRGVVIGERWPKSAAEVVVTVLEGEDDTDGKEGWGTMNVLAGCVTAASAAIVDAGIDCVDLVAGGVAAAVEAKDRSGEEVTVLDPCPREHETFKAACVVGYLQSRDEITELWIKGDAGSDPEGLIDRAVEAASLARVVLADAVREGADQKYQDTPGNANGSAVKSDARSQDIEMKG